MPSANKTPKLGLNQWLGNEYVKRQDFVEDNKNIDDAFSELEETVKNIDLSSTKVNRPNGKNVEESLSANEESITEHEGLINDLKLSVSNGKSQIATAITGKGISASGNDTFSVLAGKIDGITVEILGGKRWAIGETKKTENVTFYYPGGSEGPGYIARVNVNLDFEPKLVLCRIKGSKSSDGLYGKLSMGYLDDGYLYSNAKKDLSTAVERNKSNMIISSSQLAIPLYDSNATTVYEWMALE